jgi:hypothetical protein
MRAIGRGFGAAVSDLVPPEVGISRPVQSPAESRGGIIATARRSARTVEDLGALPVHLQALELDTFYSWSRSYLYLFEAHETGIRRI